MYWTTITVGPLLIGASLSLTSWLVTESMQSVAAVRGARELLLKLLPIVLNGAAFALLYVMIPNRRVLIKEVLREALGPVDGAAPAQNSVHGEFGTAQEWRDDPQRLAALGAFLADPTQQAQVRDLARRLAAWTRLEEWQIEEVLAELQAGRVLRAG